MGIHVGELVQKRKLDSMGKGSKSGENLFVQDYNAMLIEAHWKVIKGDFLPKFFRPRLDLVTYVIINRLLPHHQRRYSHIVSGREIAAWRKDIKREWKSLSLRTVHTNSHATNVSQWTCSCRGFLMSRWPMCSHLINSITGMETGTDFFKTVKRQGIYPFLRHSALQNEDIDVQISGKDFIEFIFFPKANTKY